MVFSFLEAHSTSAFDDDDGECRVAAWPWPSRLGGQRERHKMLLVSTYILYIAFYKTAISSEED
jgi:hypothetical protein